MFTFQVLFLLYCSSSHLKKAKHLSRPDWADRTYFEKSEGSRKYIYFVQYGQSDISEQRAMEISGWDFSNLDLIIESKTFSIIETALQSSFDINDQNFMDRYKKSYDRVLPELHKKRNFNLTRVDEYLTHKQSYGKNIHTYYALMAVSEKELFSYLKNEVIGLFLDDFFEQRQSREYKLTGELIEKMLR